MDTQITKSHGVLSEPCYCQPPLSTTRFTTPITKGILDQHIFPLTPSSTTTRLSSNTRRPWTQKVLRYNDRNQSHLKLQKSQSSLMCFLRTIACSWAKEAPDILILPAAEKSTGQYREQALTGSISPTDFRALAISYEQKKPLYLVWFQSKSDSCFNKSL